MPDVLAMLLSLSLASTPLPVGGDAVCPSPAAVEKSLAALLSVGAQSPRRARISDIDLGFEVVLESAEGTILARKRFARRADCGQGATVAAVVLAAWEHGLAEQVVGLELPHRAFLPMAVPQLKWTLDVGAFALVVVSDGLGTGLELSGNASLGRRGLGVETVGMFAAPRPLTLSGGKAFYWRWVLGAGPSWTVLAGPTRWMGSVQPLVSLLGLQGSGFSQNARHSIAEWGVRAGLRVELWRGLFRPTLGIAAVGWPARQALRHTNLGIVGERELARAELWGSVGVVAECF
jgi:hypothetical protein